MKKYLYVLGSANTEGNGNLSEHGRWDSIAKGHEIRDTIGKVEDNVVKIITSSEKCALQTAEGIAEGIGLRNYGINLNHNLCENDCNETSIIQIIKLVEEFINNYLIVIIITHCKNIELIVEQLGLTGKQLDEKSNLAGYHFEIERV